MTAPDTNVTELSVSDLSAAIKRTVEDRFGLVRVRGEIGRVSRPRSGHVYLSLKDDRAVIDGVIWKGVAARMAIAPEEGLEVIATGKLTTFAGQSKYQIVIEAIEPAGAGALMAMLEARKKALAAEGLFAAERKRALPFLPEVIGVVTSPSGAVIRDILHRLADRFPRRVLVWPVAVQGQKCAAEVATAIRGFNALSPDGPIPRPDVLIVARGGGSLEDLWGFNEEVVVRAAAESVIPLISAVGHETDTTLIDYASDRRAPTPTAAAEMAVPVRADLLAGVAQLDARRRAALTRSMTQARTRLVQSARLLPKPGVLLAEHRQRLDLAADRLPRALESGIARRRAALDRAGGALRPSVVAARIAEARRRVAAAALRLAPSAQRGIVRRGERLAAIPDLSRSVLRLVSAAQAKLAQQARPLEALSYTRVLERGYAVVRGADSAPLTRAAQVAGGAALSVQFADGRVDAVVGGTAPKPKKSAATPAKQGDLFG